MGIDLRWEDENGNPLAELADPGALVERFLPHLESKDFPCLRFVDPYGDTVFDQLQIPQVVTESEKLLEQPPEPEVERRLRAALEFVGRARG